MIDASNLLVATKVALRTTIIKQTTTMVKSRPLEYRRFSWCRWHCTTIVSLSHEWMHSWSRRSWVWVCVDFLRRICWLVEWYNRSWLDGYVLRLCLHMKIGISYKIVTYGQLFYTPSSLSPKEFSSENWLFLWEIIETTPTILPSLLSIFLFFPPIPSQGVRYRRCFGKDKMIFPFS